MSKDMVAATMDNNKSTQFERTENNNKPFFFLFRMTCQNKINERTLMYKRIRNMYIRIRITFKYILMSTEKKGVKQLTTHTVCSTQCYTAAFQPYSQNIGICYNTNIYIYGKKL